MIVKVGIYILLYRVPPPPSKTYFSLEYNILLVVLNNILIIPVSVVFQIFPLMFGKRPIKVLLICGRMVIITRKLDFHLVAFYCLCIHLYVTKSTNAMY